MPEYAKTDETVAYLNEEPDPVQEVIDQEWEEAIARQRRKEENWEAEPRKMTFTNGSGWTEVRNGRNSNIIKVGQLNFDQHFIDDILMQEYNKTIPGLGKKEQEDKSSTFCTGGATRQSFVPCNSGKSLAFINDYSILNLL